MATAAQIHANQCNAQLSTGPTSPEGQARVSKNRVDHGMAGTFHVLGWENPEQFESLAHEMIDGYQPQTPEEHRLVASIAQHFWLMQRAITLQELLTERGTDISDYECKRMALFMRYQSTNERAYYKAMRELQNVRKQKRAEEIGFESQKRQQEAHESKTRLANARAEALEVDTDVRKTVEVPLPGNTRISFSEIQDACAGAILALQIESSKAAAASADLG